MLPMIKSENVYKKQQRVCTLKKFSLCKFHYRAPKFPGSWIFLHLKENGSVPYGICHSMREYLKIKQSIKKNVFMSVYHVAGKKSLVSLIHLSIDLRSVMSVSYYGCRKEFLYS